eukprot:2305679-Pyramimonas_sp.AAC.2
MTPSKLIEDLRVVARPTDPEYPIGLRGAWGNLYAAIHTLGSIPGAFEVCERRAVLCIRPRWIWCSPLLTVYPADVATKWRVAAQRTGVQ